MPGITACAASGSTTRAGPSSSTPRLCYNPVRNFAWEGIGMGCRVGMSGEPEERIKYWKRMEGHTGGEVLAVGLTYDQSVGT